MSGPPLGQRPIDPNALVERLKARGERERVVAHAGQVLTGRLVRHGEANYEFREDASRSYFVELLTSSGPVLRWGVDLQRALAQSESQAKVGEMVGVQRVGYQLIATPPGSEAAQARRTRWRIDRVERFAVTGREARQRREALEEERRQVRQRPELRAAYVSLAVAREFAEQRIRDPEDRERFLQRLREVMAVSMAARSGESVARWDRRRRDPDVPAR